MSMCGVYGIYNTISKKWYVGQSVNIRKRFADHINKLRKGVHRNVHLQRSFVQSGEPSFEFRVLESGLLPDALNARECFWIDYYHSLDDKFGYNLESGGNENKCLSKTTLERLSLSHKGKVYGPRSVETKLKISRANLGKVRSDEVCRRKSEACKANPKIVAHCKRLAEANKGRVASVVAREHMSESIRNNPLRMEQARQLSKLYRNRVKSEVERKLASERVIGDPVAMARIRKMGFDSAGRVVSDVTRLKLSKAIKGNTARMEHIAKLGRSRKGQSVSLDARRKMSIARKGVPCSVTHRQHIIEGKAKAKALRTQLENNALQDHQPVL